MSSLFDDSQWNPDHGAHQSHHGHKGHMMHSTHTPSLWHHPSFNLVQTSLKQHAPVRAYYLQNPNLCPAPIISCSSFLPPPLRTHLMTKKKNLACGIKYVNGDEITNMEAAFHTFLNPFAAIYLHGDYRFELGGRGHTVQSFTPGPHNQQKARVVILSASVHMDFEYEDIMFELARLGWREFRGEGSYQQLIRMEGVPNGWSKKDDKDRVEYDVMIKRFLVWNLTEQHMLPPKQNLGARAQILTPDQAIHLLSQHLLSGYQDIRSIARNAFIKARDHLLSLELLINVAKEQVSNEFKGLEYIFSSSFVPAPGHHGHRGHPSPAPHDAGYIYTYDPPAIFARYLEPTLINRFMCSGLQILLISGFKPEKLRVYAFNDYSDHQAIPILQHLLKPLNIPVVPKSVLFPSPKYTYSPPRHLFPAHDQHKQNQLEKATLVLHNNSDAFGQNIENEPPGMSMDGALGCESSAAGSLRREGTHSWKWENVTVRE